MAKKTKMMKVLGRTDFIVKAAINKLPNAPFKEMVTYLDFTSK